MPTYTYTCDRCNRELTIYQAPLNQEYWPCKGCGFLMRRRPFYIDTAVTGLPTRGPIIPPAPLPRSSEKENTNTWKEMLDEYAYESHKHDRKYGRGGEYADAWDERPRGVREG